MTRARFSPIRGTTSQTVPKCDDVEPVEEVRGRTAVVPPAGRAKRAVHRDDQQEGDADSRQRLVRRRVVLAVGIDHGDGARQARFGRVVVDHDDFQAGVRRGGKGIEGGDAAVHRHDKADAFGLEAQQCGRVGAVAFRDAIGDVDGQVGARRAEEPAQQCG